MTYFWENPRLGNSTAKWHPELSYDRRVKSYAGDEPVTVHRQAFVLRKEHIGKRLSSALGNVNKADVDSVYVWDTYPDGDVVDVIVNKRLHLDQWRVYSGKTNR